MCFSKVLSLDTLLPICHPYGLVGTSSTAIEILFSQHFCFQDEHIPELGISRTQERIMTARMREIKSSNVSVRYVRVKVTKRNERNALRDK